MASLVQGCPQYTVIHSELITYCHLPSVLHDFHPSIRQTISCGLPSTHVIKCTLIQAANHYYISLNEFRLISQHGLVVGITINRVCGIGSYCGCEQIVSKFVYQKFVY